MTDPTESQMQAFMATDLARPVIVLNCHRYFSVAGYADDFSDERYPTSVSGREAYHRYLKEVAHTGVLSPQGLLINTLS